MFSIGNDELKKKPPIGDTINCPNCGQIHTIKYGHRILTDGTTEPDTLLTFYTCKKKTYLAGIAGKQI